MTGKEVYCIKHSNKGTEKKGRKFLGVNYVNFVQDVYDELSSFQYFTLLRETFFLVSSLIIGNNFVVVGGLQVREGGYVSHIGCRGTGILFYKCKLCACIGNHANEHAPKSKA